MKKIQITLALMLVASVVQAQITYVESDLDSDLYDLASFAVVSPDGKFVYVSAGNDDAIVIFFQK